MPNFLQSHILAIFETNSPQQIAKIRLIKSWESWVWDRDLPENMKFKSGKSKSSDNLVGEGEVIKEKTVEATA